MSTCPTDADLNRYHAGEMEPSEAALIRDHIASCAGCMERDAALLAEHEAMMGGLRELKGVGGLDVPTTPLPGRVEDAIPVADGAARKGGESVAVSSVKHLDRVGPYKIRETLGEGGFGVVYLAEQVEPIRRRVALKILKPGMDSKAVIARFEAERQALAMMDHLNVAHVLDAGATEHGRPYFVMEYVPGVPITDYCDRHTLTTQERLELYIQVCEAVQHAHQRGLIHRDLKPTNVLVCVQDDHAIPKVIDFGLAKAIGHRLSEQTIYTEQGVLIGTPEYMSPEQAEMTGLNIDTRTDIYALGVLLYELLVGTLPFDSKSLRRAGYAEIQRIIREEEPPKPSTRLSRLGTESATVAVKRRSDAPSLLSQIRGDLDWITMKALEKDRTRRYSSASELAADVRRHLGHEVVLASPPSPAYRARKFVRRHRLGVAAGVVIAMTLVTATGVSIEFGLREAAARGRERQALTRADSKAEEAKRQAEAAEAARELAEKRADETQRVAEFQSRMLGKIDVKAMGRGLRRAFHEQVQAALERQYVEDESGHRKRTSDEIAEELAKFDERAAAAEATDVARQVMGEYVLRPAAEAIKKQFGDQPLVEAQLREAVGMTYRALGLYVAAELHLRAALDLRRRELGSDDPRVATSLVCLSLLLIEKGDCAAAEPLSREALAIRRKLLGPEAPEVAESMNNLAGLLNAKGDRAGAEPLFREALAITRQAYGAEHPAMAGGLNNLAGLLRAQGDYAGAEPLYREALTITRKVYGAEDLWVATILNNLAALLKQKGDYAAAAPLYREALAIFRKVIGAEHPTVGTSLNNLAELLEDQGDYVSAEPLFREALAIFRKVHGAEHPEVAATLNNLATLLETTGDHAGAEPLYREALAIQQKRLPPEHDSVIDLRIRLSSALLGRAFDKAQPPKSRIAWFVEAEELLQAACAALSQSPNVPADRMRYVLDALAKLYKAWNAIEPGKGYDVKAAEWQTKLPGPTSSPSTLPAKAENPRDEIRKGSVD